MALSLASVVMVPMTIASGVARAGGEDETKLRSNCAWLERAIGREPNRDDAIMMFMRGMRPKCTALIEGLERKDGSITVATIASINKDLKDLQDVVEPDWRAAHPNEPDPAVAEKAAADKAAADKAAADKAAAEKAAADKAAADKAAAEKAAADKAAADKAAAERAAADKAAALGDKERLAAEKQAENDRIAAEKQAEKDRIAAEKARIAAEKQAEKDRLAAEKKAAEQAEKDRIAAERAERDRVAAEKRALEQVERDQAAADKAEREQLARDLAAADALRKERDANPATARVSGRLDGTWEQPPTKVLDRNIKRTLNLISNGKKVEGELYEEVWFPAPAAWIDRSCGGNTTFRMVSTARVSGTLDGRGLELRRDVPRILACTCSSRCTVEDRRRGMDLELSASGLQLSDDAGVFSKPGAAGSAAMASSGGAVAGGAPALGGEWETSPFKAQDRKVVLRLELAEKDGRVTGTLVERSSQPLPLQNWSERFCGGADKWEWVTQWKIDGKGPKGRNVELVAKDGENILCTCPSKCKSPDKKRPLDLVVGPDGRSITEDGHVYERR